MSPLIELPITTDDGIYLAHYSAKGLAELDFPNADGLLAESNLATRRSVNAKIPMQTLRWHRQTTNALKSVLAGRMPSDLPPIDWTGRTDFQQAVWREMLKLRPGKTKSYGEIAAAIGRPKAVRAVGGACGSNPIPVLVPCHRVLAANGKIGGFSSGLGRKRNLLAREGVTI
jgi:O-6-methylguanine DNA methyltransferase